jgi:hypothetical protein
VDLDLPGGRQRAATADVSARGFAALMGSPPEVGATGRCTLKLGGDTLVGDAQVVDVRKQPYNYRVAFTFTGLNERDRERLEIAVFDMVLEQIASK